MTGTIARLEALLRTVPQRLVDIPDDAVALKPAPNRWSKKEILGHLIDSTRRTKCGRPFKPPIALSRYPRRSTGLEPQVICRRSEERRVGKEGRSRWSPYH